MIAAIILLLQTIEPTNPLSDYGIWGIIAWLVFRDIVPIVREHFGTSHKAKLQREERQIAVLEQFSSQLHTFGLAMTTTAERLTNIERDQEAVRDTLLVLADRKQQARRQSD
jgi:hypothetical protein